MTRQVPSLVTERMQLESAANTAETTVSECANASTSLRSSTLHTRTKLPEVAAIYLPSGDNRMFKYPSSSTAVSLLSGKSQTFIVLEQDRSVVAPLVMIKETTLPE